MILAGWFVAGAAIGLASWALLRPVFAQPLFARQNHRGVPVPTAVGVLLPLVAIAVEAVRTLVDAVRDDTGGGWLAVTTGSGPARLEVVAGAGETARVLVVVAVTAFGLLGLLDDLAGSAADGRGFRGHLRALRHGRLTTGLVKLLGGAAAATIVCRTFIGSPARLVADALLVALAANLGNLFDRAPGRATKVGLLAFAGLVVAAGDTTALAGVAVVAGAAAGLLVPDLRERLMLGDAGANALGAALGLGAVLTLSASTRTAILLVLLALNVASEAVSFSRVIDRVPPLRWLDRAGRPG